MKPVTIEFTRDELMTLRDIIREWNGEMSPDELTVPERHLDSKINAACRNAKIKGDDK